MLSIIITAGGLGKRMGGDIPKQFMILQNKPILMHTLEVCAQFDSRAQLIVALPENQISFWKELCQKHKCSIEHTIVAGGTERFDSIKNALKIATGDFIAVHDGVRPIISQKLLQDLWKEVKQHQAVIPVIALKDSIRLINGEQSASVPRTNYCAVQTPQLFVGDILRKAYEQTYKNHFTDDASVVESIGVKIRLIQGEDSNIKITNPTDLLLAEILLKQIPS